MTASQVPLKYLAALNPEVLDESTDPDCSFYYIDIATTGRGCLREEPEPMSFDEAPSRARRVLRPGDTILSTVRTYLRAAWTARDTADRLVASTGFVCFRPSAEIDPRYLGWLAQADTVVEEVVARSVGVSYPAITPTEVGRIKAPCPPLKTQRAIADYLDRESVRINALIAAKRRLVRLLTEHASALKARWYAQLVADAGTMPLRRTLTSLEQGSSPQCYSHTAADCEWGVLKTSSVSSGIFIPTENKRLPETDLPDLRWIVHDNDVLIVRGSGSLSAVGQAAVATVGKRKLLLSDLLYRTRLRNSLPAFIVMALQSPQVRQQIVGSIRSDAGQTLKIRGDDLKDLLVPAVQPSKQEKAVYKLCTELDRVLSVSRSLEPSITLLQERRQALITAAVTGQLDIPEVA